VFYREKQQLNKPASRTTFQVGDIVWLFSGDKHKTVTAKAQPPWQGPFSIEHIISPTNVYIDNCSVVNTRRLKRVIGVSLQQVIFNVMAESVLANVHAAFPSRL
jgi:hypothetical protein